MGNVEAGGGEGDPMDFESVVPETKEGNEKDAVKVMTIKPLLDFRGGGKPILPALGSLSNAPPGPSEDARNRPFPGKPLFLPVQDVLNSAVPIPLSEEMSKKKKLEQYLRVCSQVLPFLYVGSEEVAKSQELLNSNGVTHIINCAGLTVPNYFPDKYCYLNLQLYDSKEEDLSWFLYEVIDFIEEARRISGESKCLVHCAQGVSRSCAFVIAYVMWLKSCPFAEAFTEVKLKRPISSPNSGFICNLLEWQSYREGSASDESVLFRIAVHGKHDPDKLVPKICLKADRSLLPPTLASLDSKGVFILHPARWEKSEHMVIWRGEKADPVSFQVAVTFAERIKRYERPELQITIVIQGKPGPEEKLLQTLLSSQENMEAPIFHDLGKQRALDLSRLEVEGKIENPEPPLPAVVTPTSTQAESLSSDDGAIALYRFEPSKHAWECMGVYDNDDLQSDSLLLLQERASGLFFAWVGQDIGRDHASFFGLFGRYGEGSSRDSDLTDHVMECVIRSSMSEYFAQDRISQLVIVHEHDEDEDFWTLFESGY